MPLALITKHFSPACCGVGDYTAQLARALADGRAAPIVFTATNPVEEQTGFRVISLELGSWSSMRRLLRRLKEERVDTVQLEYSAYGWGRWGFAFRINALVAALRRRGLPVTVALHEFPLRIVQHPLQFPVIAIQWMHVWLLAACAGRVLANTEPRVALLRRLLPWGQEKVQYRPNSSTVPILRISNQQREAIRAQNGAEPNTLVVGCFGMFGAGKNYEAVLGAAAMARKEFPLQVWLLGNWEAARPSYIERLRSLIRDLGIEDAVRWPGFLPSEGISAHFQACDLFVLPQPDGHLTRSSAFMAAAAHSLPVVAVRNRACQSEFLHGRNVWLVNTSEPGVLSEAIVTLANQPQLRQSLGRELGSLYESKFDWPRAVAAAHGTPTIVRKGFHPATSSSSAVAGERSRDS